YVYGDGVDQLLARDVASGQPNAGVAFYLTDRLGSVRDIMNTSQVIQDNLNYDGFGNMTESNTAVGDRYKYTGREFDYNTGLQYNRGRYLILPVGRWLSEDPSGFGAGDSNLYRYVQNEPTNAVDPSGLDIILLLDPAALHNVGHPGIIIGSETGSRPGEIRYTGPGWHYFSFSTGNTSWSTLDNLEHKFYLHFSDVLNQSYFSRYKYYIWFGTSPLKDSDALAAANSWDKANVAYNLVSNNCAKFCEYVLENSCALRVRFGKNGEPIDLLPRYMFLETPRGWFLRVLAMAEFLERLSSRIDVMGMWTHSAPHPGAWGKFDVDFGEWPPSKAP